ncbi:MAG: TetR/AcrR family transcriptional regulator [Dermatophilaceae bacterium]|nr:TetR/AcrR family transcriptional regulator [Intrasporangiaceae bacterium]
MAMPVSERRLDRASARRQVTIDEALDHAEQIVAEQGAGALTIAEIARQMGMRPPSLYKYFPSLHGVYDALFARGNARLAAYVEDAVRDLDPGLERLLESTRAILRWSMFNRGLAPLLFWRPIPGFEPSPASYALAEQLLQRSRADLTTAVRNGELGPHADTDEVFRLFTSISAGLGTQQLPNEPDATYESGLFTSLTDQALEMFVQQHSPPPGKARR